MVSLVAIGVRCLLCVRGVAEQYQNEKGWLLKLIAAAYGGELSGRDLACGLPDLTRSMP